MSENLNENVFKTVTAAIIAAVASYFKVVGTAIFALLIFMITDYITGMTAAYMSGTLSSKTGFHGVIKKLCYMFAVVSGIGIDYVCTYALDGVGISGGTYFFSLLVSVWLILNEIISILENLDKIGVPVPGFIKAISGRLRQVVEKRGDDRAGKADDYGKKDQDRE